LGHAVADNFIPAGYSSKNDPYQPASGGADGSLLLSDDESSRQINDPMQRFRDFLLPKYQKYASDDVSAADFVQAAGNIGVASCPGGPIIKTVSAARMFRPRTGKLDGLLTLRQVIGRSDSTKAAPEGTLPFSFGPGSDYNSLITLWEEKGINPRELAALMGAHSVSRSFTRQENGIPNGGNYILPDTRCGDSDMMSRTTRSNSEILGRLVLLGDTSQEGSERRIPIRLRRQSCEQDDNVWPGFHRVRK
jgi:hypothetical protein